MDRKKAQTLGHPDCYDLTNLLKTTLPCLKIKTTEVSQNFIYLEEAHLYYEENYNRVDVAQWIAVLLRTQRPRVLITAKLVFVDSIVEPI